MHRMAAIHGVSSRQSVDTVDTNIQGGIFDWLLVIQKTHFFSKSPLHHFVKKVTSFKSYYFYKMLWMTF